MCRGVFEKMSYENILKQIPGDAEVGLYRRVPAFIYFNGVVENLAVRELGYENGLNVPFNPKCKKFLENLELGDVIEILKEKADLETHPKGWNFKDPQEAYASRTESQFRANGLLRILTEK